MWNIVHLVYLVAHIAFLHRLTKLSSQIRFTWLYFVQTTRLIDIRDVDYFLHLFIYYIVYITSIFYTI